MLPDTHGHGFLFFPITVKFLLFTPHIPIVLLIIQPTYNLLLETYTKLGIGKYFVQIKASSELFRHHKNKKYICKICKNIHLM